LWGQRQCILKKGPNKKDDPKDGKKGNNKKTPKLDKIPKGCNLDSVKGAHNFFGEIAPLAADCADGTEAVIKAIEKINSSIASRYRLERSGNP
jgi:hypothetical protein